MKKNMVMGLCFVLSAQLIGLCAFAKGRIRTSTEKMQTNLEVRAETQRNADLSAGANKGNSAKEDFAALDKVVVTKRNGQTWTKAEIAQEKAAIKVFADMKSKGISDAGELVRVLKENRAVDKDRALTPDGWQNLMTVAARLEGNMFRNQALLVEEMKNVGLDIADFRGCTWK